jgi:two-component SAPR family response regulator
MNSKQRALPNREVYPPATSWGAWRATKPSRVPVVLIVDEDLGFVWWLCQIFSQAGCQVVPALNSAQTDSLARNLNLKVDVIVVNPELEGVSELIGSLSTARHPKIIAIRNHNTRARLAFEADATLERPSGWGPVSEQEGLGCVRRLVKDVKVTSVA